MKFKLKVYSLIIFINLIITVTHAVDRIVLIGDSILDNAYWNEVAANTTGQCLVKILNSDDTIQHANGTNVLIDDRSVEETTVETIVKALETDGKIDIPCSEYDFCNNYINRRKNNGVAYDSKSEYSARLYQYCNIDTDKYVAKVDILTDIENSHIFISAGGNDVVLKGSNFFTIIDNIKKVGKLYKNAGAKTVNYIIPYTMTTNIGFVSSYALNFCRHIFKVIYLNNLTSGYYDNIIDLSDFDESYRIAHNTIPEPTIKGAREIANRIINIYTSATGSILQDGN